MKGPRRRIGLVSFLSFLLFLALAPTSSRGHQMSTSTSELEIGERSVRGKLRFFALELATVVPIVRDGAGRISPAALEAAAPELRRLVVSRFVVSTDGEPCDLAPGAVSLDGTDGILLEASWRCSRSIESLSVRLGFFELLPAGHVHFSKLVLRESDPPEMAERLAQADLPGFELERRVGARAAAERFLRLGIWHIFTGYDHIAFLLGLLLLGGTLSELIKIVTSFTLAHSITLALAALDLVTPPSRLIEPLIAASIVCVAAENLWALRSPSGPAGADGRAAALRHRWILTFAFGLVHGFGFASVLRELELPRASLAAGLVTFNLGVEVGQVCIVALALPLLAALLRRRWFAIAGARVSSGAIGCLGAFWLLRRLLARIIHA